MKNITYLIIISFNLFSFSSFANNECSSFLENNSLAIEHLSGKSLNAKEIFLRLDQLGPIEDQLNWPAVMAKFPDGTEVLQFGARVNINRLSLTLQKPLKALIERLDEITERQKALRLAKLDPERIDRFYLINPDLRNSPLEQVFENGIEFLIISISDTEGNILGLKTFTSYLPDSVQLSLFDLDNITKFIDATNLNAKIEGKTPLRIDIFHNHPEQEPLSPSDIGFSRFLARHYGLVSEIYAYIIKDDKSYIFVSPIAIGAKVTITD